MDDCRLRMDDLCVKHHGRIVLGPLKLEVHPGELLGVVGPNGAGKSSLLQVMSGMQKPAAGQLLVSDSWRTAYLLQHHDFVPTLPFNVSDVVHFGRAGFARPSRRCNEEDRLAVAAALTEMDLGQLRHRLYRELSGGEQRKVQIARMLAQEADVLLLDEPTAGLDMDWQERITLIVERLHRETGKTIVMVTHDVDRLPASCFRVLLLKNGRTQALGKPEDVLHSATLSALYDCRLEVRERNGRYHAFNI